MMTPTRKFKSYNSLREERERRLTFSNWPMKYDNIHPNALAEDGFHYQKIFDHCACVFGRGIIGEWEVGDTPRGEHKRHFPRCPFIQGQPVGNIPLSHSIILDKLPLLGEERPLPPTRFLYTTDIDVNETNCSGLMAGSISDDTPSNDYEALGFIEYSPPKRLDRLTKRSRLETFVMWPELGVPTPEALADAGFFYCGVSDHVRCFHCGNGIRNWMIDSEPLTEHSRWYPKCNFVRQKVNQIDIATARVGLLKESSGRFNPISTEDLEVLMQSDIIVAISNMNFPYNLIRIALSQKLARTGLPYYCLDQCIEDVIQLMIQEEREKHKEPPTEFEELSTEPLELEESVSAASMTESVEHSPPLLTLSNRDNSVTNVDEEEVISSSPTLDESDQMRSNQMEMYMDEVVERELVLSLSPEELSAFLERLLHRRRCKVCMDAQITVVFLPCSHMVACSECSLSMLECPICRGVIKYTINPIIS